MFQKAHSTEKREVYTTTVETLPFSGSGASVVYIISGPMVYTLFPCCPKQMVYTIAFFCTVTSRGVYHFCFDVQCFRLWLSENPCRNGCPVISALLELSDPTEPPIAKHPSHDPCHTVFSENQTCTKLWLPFRVALLAPFSRRGICLFPVPENALFQWEVILFLQNLLYESTVFPTGNLGQNVTRNGGPQVGACLILSDVFAAVSHTIAATPPLLSVIMAYRNPKTGLQVGGGVSQDKLAFEAYRATGGIARNSIANRKCWKSIA